MTVKTCSVSLGVACTPRATNPQVGENITVLARVTNIGDVPIPAGWRTHLTLDPTDGMGTVYDYDYETWISPIVVGGYTDTQMTMVPIVDAMIGKSYDVVVIVYNTDKSVEYARGKCVGLLVVQGAQPGYDASLTNVRADPSEYQPGDEANIKFNIANTGNVRTTYYTYISIWHPNHSAAYGPFRDAIDPNGNASLGKLIQLDANAPYGWYEITVTVQYPDGTTLDEWVEADAFEVVSPPQQYIWGYVTDAFSIPAQGVAVKCDNSGATVFTGSDGYYNLDPQMAGLGLSITASDPLGRYSSQTKSADYDGYTPVRLDFALPALTTEVTVTNFHVNGH